MGILHTIARNSENNYVNINDAEKGVEYFCCDTKCNGEMIVRDGKVNQKHFAHKNKSGNYSNCSETFIHLMTKNSIADIGYININRKALSFDLIKLKLENIVIEKKGVDSRFIPDIQADLINHFIFGTCKVWIEVVKTSDLSEEKAFYLQDKNILVIKKMLGKKDDFDLERLKLEIEKGGGFDLFDNLFVIRLIRKVLFKKLLLSVNTNIVLNKVKDPILTSNQNQDIISSKFEKIRVNFLNLKNNVLKYSLLDYYKDLRSKKVTKIKYLILFCDSIEKLDDYFVKNELDPNNTEYCYLNPTLLDYLNSELNEYDFLKKEIEIRIKKEAVLDRKKRDLDRKKRDLELEKSYLELENKAKEEKKLKERIYLKFLEDVKNLNLELGYKIISSTDGYSFSNSCISVDNVFKKYLLIRHKAELQSNSDFYKFTKLLCKIREFEVYAREIGKYFLVSEKFIQDCKNVLSKIDFIDTTSSNASEVKILSEITILIDTVGQIPTKQYLLDSQDAYWKWNLYQLPLNDFQISRNYHRAKEFYKGYQDLMTDWKKDFIEKTKLDSKQIQFFSQLSQP